MEKLRFRKKLLVPGHKESHWKCREKTEQPDTPNSQSQELCSARVLPSSSSDLHIFPSKMHLILIKTSDTIKPYIRVKYFVLQTYLTPWFGFSLCRLSSVFCTGPFNCDVRSQINIKKPKSY